MVVGKAPGGGDLVVGGGDGGAIPPEALPQYSGPGSSNQNTAGLGAPKVGEIGFGRAARM